jgi:hypothetical protein
MQQHSYKTLKHINTFQTILLFEFLLWAFLQALATNKLNKLAHDLYPIEKYPLFRPSNRVLKKIKIEYNYDRIVIRKLNQARRIERAGWIVFAIFIVTFFVGL